MLIYNDLNQYQTNSVKINLNALEQKRVKINLSLFFKMIFFKHFFLKKNSIILKNKTVGNKLFFNHDHFFLKKNLNKILNDFVYPTSNICYQIQSTFKRLAIYYTLKTKLRNKFFTSLRKRKNSTKFKKKVFLKLINVILNLKLHLLNIKNFNFLINSNAVTKKKSLFLFFKKKFTNKMKNNYFKLLFLKNNYNSYNFKLLIHFLKNKKKLIKQSSRTNLLYSKLIGLFTKKGEKRKSLKIINTALLTVSKEIRIPINEVLIKLYKKLSTSVEIKKIKIRRSFHFIPFPVNLKRRLYLIIKWFIFALSTFKIKKNLGYKLSEEILKILKNQESLVDYSKKYQIQKSFKYQANTHFRW